MKSQTIPKTGLDAFFDYCRSFYGVNGIYDLGVSDDQIKAAITLLVYGNDKYRCGVDFCGDSIDREHVRAILEDLFITQV